MDSHPTHPQPANWLTGWLNRCPGDFGELVFGVYNVECAFDRSQAAGGPDAGRKVAGRGATAALHAFGALRAPERVS